MQLNNYYYLLRHGHSLANQQHLIVSDIRHGREAYGLSPSGIEQVRHTLAQWPFPSPTLVFHSDFQRTTQTAALAADYFSTTAYATPALRERHFGTLELKSDEHYPSVWQQDVLEPYRSDADVESLQSVCQRQIDFLQQLEPHYQQQHILLVGHGDPLQILLTHQQGRVLGQHRTLTPLATAEVRALHNSL